MKIYLTTTQTQTDPRNIAGWPLDQAWGVKLAYWASANNNIINPAGWTAYAQQAMTLKPDMLILDREVHPEDNTTSRVAAIQAVRAVVGPAMPLMFYGASMPFFGCPPGMSLWQFIDPMPAELDQIVQFTYTQASYAALAGAVCIYAQCMRPTEYRTIERQVRQQCYMASLAAPKARKILFIEDTYNWSQNNFPPISRDISRLLLNLARLFDMDVCIFQPFAIDKNYPWRPLWDVLGEYLVCVDDREPVS